ncbi:hypothetical protein B0T16DRAFT_392894 [Cercophora newfieldiana]|uniref:Uncharacterized protein n=1 Tax=Cercophora newfieldiana TaxID=92897 RepID=A0AA39Y221_9PEZI|nr:hypothetical protein B0T16DRAFT_392894 [Cercophora newfieldiana]
MPVGQLSLPPPECGHVGPSCKTPSTNATLPGPAWGNLARSPDLLDATGDKLGNRTGRLANAVLLPEGADDLLEGTHASRCIGCGVVCLISQRCFPRPYLIDTSTRDAHQDPGRCCCPDTQLESDDALSRDLSWIRPPGQTVRRLNMYPSAAIPPT